MFNKVLKSFFVISDNYVISAEKKQLCSYCHEYEYLVDKITIQDKKNEEQIGFKKIRLVQKLTDKLKI